MWNIEFTLCVLLCWKVEETRREAIRVNTTWIDLFFTLWRVGLKFCQYPVSHIAAKQIVATAAVIGAENVTVLYFLAWKRDWEEKGNFLSKCFKKWKFQVRRPPNGTFKEMRLFGIDFPYPSKNSLYPSCKHQLTNNVSLPRLFMTETIYPFNYSTTPIRGKREGVIKNVDSQRQIMLTE